jgi:DNA-binding NtrC family response regulator
MFARYFIEQYRVQYSKAVRDLSTEVCEALMQYSWPGNIRELQHRVLRAVIFSNEVEMQLSDIELPGINFEQELAESERQNQESRSKSEEEIVEVESQPVRSVDLTLRFSDIVRELLQNYLGNQSPWPFFPSIEFELIRAAHDWSLERARQGARGSTVKRASERIGVPTATYRRKLQEAERTAEYPNGTDTELQDYADLIRELVDTTNDTNLIRTWKQKTFELTQELAPKDTKTGAQIFGTSEQTWRNWLSRGGPA